MARIQLIQPQAGGHISGGYLYNARMAEHGAWELRSVSEEALPTVVERAGGDLVIADSLWLTERGFEPFLRLKARGVRLGVMLHLFPSLGAAASGQAKAERPARFEVDLLAQVDVVVAPGRHCAELLQGYGLPVQICEPGIEDAWRTPPRRRRGRCELVSVGAVAPRKGFLDVLTALLRRPPKTPFRWTVVGSLEVDPVYARAVAERARAFDGVVLMGQRGPDEVRRIVTGADVLVMPSYAENQPLVLLEAMAASVPPVVYAAGGAALMVAHGTEGLVGPVGDQAALADHLSWLVDDESERYRMARACWERQRQLPSWQAAAQRARRLLEACVRLESFPS